MHGMKENLCGVSLQIRDRVQCLSMRTASFYVSSLIKGRENGDYMDYYCMKMDGISSTTMESIDAIAKEVAEDIKSMGWVWIPEDTVTTHTTELPGLRNAKRMWYSTSKTPALGSDTEYKKPRTAESPAWSPTSPAYSPSSPSYMPSD